MNTNLILRYINIKTLMYNLQAEQAELWHEMTPDERRYATSPNILPNTQSQ